MPEPQIVPEIRRLASRQEADACAALMAGSEPWITLGRTYDEALELMTSPAWEVYVAIDDGRVLGFIIVVMTGAFVGYIRSIAVAHEARGMGIGSRLLEHAEARIHEESPNVFLCVSSFNPRARALYERLGYELVGPLKDFVVRGHSELLMWKSSGPLREFRPPHEGAVRDGPRPGEPGAPDPGGPAKPA
ncbi:MAG TPA: GNAT family N-acetyltransferase [Gemmatimonadaceae bacterium]|nr:GNAT family N-acetyltransferase [Gemmatimonadaceae bacterium]